MFNGLCHFGNWGNFGAWGWVAMILQTVFWIGLIAGVILLIVWAIRRSSQASTTVSGYAISGQPTAKDILQARYARGEITREQYQQMLDDLS
jgi:putative membrane protein